MRRRQFLGLASFAGLLFPVVGCHSQEDDWWKSEAGTFEHGVASGDPLSDRVIIWTRVSTLLPTAEVKWKVFRDEELSELVAQGEVSTDEMRDYTVKVDVGGLSPGQIYFYRFYFKDDRSRVGRTKTLPVGRTDRVRLASTSCSNFPAGYFHVYEEIAAQEVDAVVHLGDYLYEYHDGGYATSGAEELGRQPDPLYEVLTLADYRTRHAQYRRDLCLQSCHARHPFIMVWDDHEVANDSYRDGAANHGATEGDDLERKAAAIQAWREWTPARENDDGTIHRSFEFGDLVRLTMLDTRHEARDEQFKHDDFRRNAGIDAAQLQDSIQDPSRTMLGQSQRSWLIDEITQSDAKWHVVGQQTLMGRYELPAEMALSVDRSDNSRVELGLEIGRETLSAMNAPSDTMSSNQRELLDSFIPYNLDSWDGYAYERDAILSAIADAGARIVVLSGDTHNAWASVLTTPSGQRAGVEFGSSSVSSPGYEEAFGTLDAERIGELMTDLISDLRWVNFTKRGFVLTEYTESSASAQFLFVSTVKKREYEALPGHVVIFGHDDSFIVQEPGTSAQQAAVATGEEQNR